MDVNCPNCGVLLRITDGAEGEDSYCPACTVTLEIVDGLIIRTGVGVYDWVIRGRNKCGSSAPSPSS